MGSLAFTGTLVLVGVLTVLSLRRSSRAARGWCRHCNAPDVWTVFKHSARSKAYGAAAFVASLGVILAALLGVEFRGVAQALCWTASAAAAATGAFCSVRAGRYRMRLLRCGTCEAEYPPRRAAPC